MMFLTLSLESKSFPTNTTQLSSSIILQSPQRSEGNILQCCMNVSKMFLNLSFERKSFVTKYARTLDKITFLQAFEVSFLSCSSLSMSSFERIFSFRCLWGMAGFTLFPRVVTTCPPPWISPRMSWQPCRGLVAHTQLRLLHPWSACGSPPCQRTHPPPTPKY